jgi:hypothetical protein
MRRAATCLALLVALPGVAHATGGVHPNQLFDVSCPSATQCTALGEWAEYTFNPQAPGTVVPVSIAPATPLAPPFLTSIQCPSTRQCTAVGWKGTEITFDPTRPSTLTAPTIAPESFALDWVSCPSVGQCTALSGNVPTFGITFDPQSAQTPLAFPVGPGTGAPGTGPIACPSVAECITLGEGRETTFNPTAPGTQIPRSLSVAGRAPAGQLACVSEHQCTASGEYEVTFDPVGPSAAPRIIASGSLHGGAPSGELQAGGPLACPTATQCTMLSANFETGAATALTFDPLSTPTPTSMSMGTGDHRGLSCPSIDQCTTVDFTGRETTFNPNAPTKAVVPFVIDRLTGSLASITNAVAAGTRATVDLRCTRAPCKVGVRLLVHETLRRGRVITVGAANPSRHRRRGLAVRTLTLARTSIEVPPGTSVIRLGLNAAGRRLLAARHKLPVSLVLSQPGSPPMQQPLVFAAAPARPGFA